MSRQCLFCGRYFIPDPRVKERQKACSNTECKKKRKKAAQAAWAQKNPGYFKGRYPYIKALRLKKSMIQDGLPRTKKPQKLIFLIPDDMVHMIQDKIVLKRTGKCTFTANGCG